MGCFFIPTFISDMVWLSTGLILTDVAIFDRIELMRISVREFNKNIAKWLNCGKKLIITKIVPAYKPTFISDILYNTVILDTNGLNKGFLGGKNEKF